MLGTVTVAGERGRAVKLVHGIIKLTVGLAELRRHSVHVVQVGKCRGWEVRPRIKDSLSKRAYF